MPKAERAEYLYEFTVKGVQNYLPLLSPKRLIGTTYRVTVTRAVAPLYQACLAERGRARRDMLVTTLNLLDPPPDLALMWSGLPCAAYLLDQCVPGRADEHYRAISRLRGFIQELSVLPEGGGVQRAPTGVRVSEYLWKRYPLFTMHLISSKVPLALGGVYAPSRLSPGYRKYALEAHKAVRRVEERDGPQGYQVYDCALSLRYLMSRLVHPAERIGAESLLRDMHFAIDHLPLTPRQKDFHRYNILDALGAGDREEHGTTVGDPGGAHHRVTEESWDDGYLPSYDSPWDSQGDTSPAVPWGGHGTRIVSVIPSRPRNARHTWECPEDYAVDRVEVTGGYARSPQARHMQAWRQAQRLHRDVLMFPYTRETMQLYDYAALYELAFAHPLARQEPLAQASYTLLLLLVHLGIDPDRLLSAVVEGAPLLVSHGNEPPAPAGDQEAIGLDLTSLCLTQPCPPVGYATDKPLPSDVLSRPVVPRTTLPLPPFLSGVVRQWLRTRAQLLADDREWAHRLFVLGSPARPLTFDDLVVHLAGCGVRRPVAYLRRLARSFWPLYVNRVGMNPLYAVYVAGRAPRILATPIFYGHVNARDVAAEYRRSAVGAHQLILTAVSSSCRKVAAEVARGSRWHRTLLNVGYGSRVTPRPGTLRAFITVVRTALERLEAGDAQTLICRHNLYVAYAYVLFHVASGVRPLRDDALEEILASWQGDRLRVSDKRSNRYAEVRTLRQIPLLDMLRRGLERARAKIVALSSFDEVRYQALKCPAVFLIDPEGVPQEVTPGEIRHLFDHEFPEIGKAFPFPLNCGRHLVETELTVGGCAARDVVDYGLGHRRRWREPEGCFSGAHLRSLEAEFAGGLQRIAQEHRLEVIPYAERR